MDPKRLANWRRGVEPCGGAMHSLHRFASRMPGGPQILMGEDYQMSFFREDEQEDDGLEEDGKVGEVNEEEEDLEG